MEIIAEIIFQCIWFLFELLFSVIGEALFDWGTSKAAEKREAAPAGPVLQAFGFAAFGALCGLLSLWIAPSHFLAAPWLRWLNLIVAPLIAGCTLIWWRRLLGKSETGDEATRDFINGAALALALGLVRLGFAR
jgi:hypothetical protein